MGPGREALSVTPDERGMWGKEKMLWAWLWIQDHLNQGRLFLLVSSLIIFILVALYGYRSERPGDHVCIFNGRNFICRLLFFCTFVTMITNLTFLCLDPYLPHIQVPRYLHLICLAELATAVIWLFVWALLSMFILEQWIRSEPSSANVHSTRTIITIALAGAGCWVLMVVHLTLRLQEFKSSMTYGVSGLYAGQGETLPTKSRWDLRSRGASKSPVASV
ncbi:synaptogyrin-4-like [Mobula hypostoma]|uniref:synaptogyrin-4-like n=1 Tax=Mobula hypostoma TaxID=723540 RepID=UPI002FC2AD90